MLAATAFHGMELGPALQIESATCERNRQDQRFLLREGICGKVAGADEPQNRRSPLQLGYSSSPELTVRLSARQESLALANRRALVGGMITSTIHVLILVPVFFVMMKQRALRRNALRAHDELTTI